MLELHCTHLAGPWVAVVGIAVRVDKIPLLLTPFKVVVPLEKVGSGCSGEICFRSWGCQASVGFALSTTGKTLFPTSSASQVGILNQFLCVMPENGRVLRSYVSNATRATMIEQIMWTNASVTWNPCSFCLLLRLPLVFFWEVSEVGRCETSRLSTDPRKTFWRTPTHGSVSSLSSHQVGSGPLISLHTPSLQTYQIGRQGVERRRCKFRAERFLLVWLLGNCSSAGLVT